MNNKMPNSIVGNDNLITSVITGKHSVLINVKGNCEYEVWTLERIFIYEGSRIVVPISKLTTKPDDSWSVVKNNTFGEGYYRRKESKQC